MRIEACSPDLSMLAKEPLTPILELGDLHIHRSLLQRDMLAHVIGSLCAHAAGEFGEIDAVDRHANACSLNLGGRIVSRWRAPSSGGHSFWIVTNAARTQTTVFPDLKEK